MSTSDTLIAFVLTLLFWAVQLGITAGLALLVGWLLKKLTRRGRLLLWAACVFAVLCALLAALALDPPVVCGGEYRAELTDEAYQAVQSVSRGLYSRYLPLVPACARVTEIAQTEPGYIVRFDIHYIYFGRVEMSWTSDGGGYNRENPWS